MFIQTVDALICGITLCVKAFNESF